MGFWEAAFWLPFQFKFSGTRNLEEIYAFAVMLQKLKQEVNKWKSN